jgi:hypothetical protein
MRSFLVLSRGDGAGGWALAVWGQRPTTPVATEEG